MRMYFPLHSEEIRLVDISPGEWKDEICCTLRQAPFANNLSYKALSYVWGAPNGARRPISVNGTPHPVTANLQSALRRIRQKDKTVTFWIDALSINQADNEERSVQVGMMRKIYARAIEVVIYLGEATVHEFAGCPSGKKSSAAVPSVFHGDIRDKEKIESFQRHCISKETRMGSTSRRKLNYAHEVCCLVSLLSQSCKLDDTPPFDTESRNLLYSFYQRNVFEALRYLMRSSWWNRIWVVQEVIVPKHITLLYDSTTAPWEMFVKAAKTYNRNVLTAAIIAFPREYSDVLTFFSRIVLDIYQMRCRWETGEKSALLPLLRQFSNRKASDDRDKVYALLGLVQDQPEAASPVVTADYSLDTVTVFKNTVLDIIDSTGSLGALTGDLGRKNRQDLPSWAVDWSATYDELDRRRADDTENYDASAGFLVYTEREDDGSWSGVSVHLDQLRHKLAKDGSPVDKNLEMHAKFSKILGTSRWGDYSMNASGGRNEAECLEAIENYLAINDGPVWLRDHGKVLECPALYKGIVVGLGEPSFSNDDLESLVPSWGTLVGNFFEQRQYSHGLERAVNDAFLRTLCADMFCTHTEEGELGQRRATKEDLDQIAAWILQSGNLLSKNETFWQALAYNVDATGSSPRVSANMHASIRAATFRRRLFITDTGYIGLGPSRLQVGDALHLLVGGQVPFILRQSGQRKLPLNVSRPRLGLVNRPVFELIGDCYVNDLMDGEGMETWRTMANASLQASKVQLRKSLLALEHWQTALDDMTQSRDALGIVKSNRFKVWKDGLKRMVVEGKESQESKYPQEILHLLEEDELKKDGQKYFNFIDSQISPWLEKQNLLSWVKQADIKESVKKIEGIAKEVEQQLENARARLEDSIAEVHNMQSDSVHQSRVFLI